MFRCKTTCTQTRKTLELLDFRVNIRMDAVAIVLTLAARILALVMLIV
jgi:hypothetical protein